MPQSLAPSAPLKKTGEPGAIARYAALLVLALSLVGFAPKAQADSSIPSVLHVQANGVVAAPGRISPITTTKGLARPVAEQVVRLEKARVILADYPLIKNDFGQAIAAKYNKPIDQVSNDEIDHWLLESTAYISKSQAAQTAVNTPIPQTAETATAYRPEEYGRALVYQPQPGVLIDVKGAGATDPEQKGHSNGLATLGESIREYAYEHLIHDVFQHAHLDEKTVGHYAVIDAGFDVKQADGRTDPAGLILRQAHSRATDKFSELDDVHTKKIETVLRSFGITSAGAYQSYPFDRLNIQGTRDGKAILDFGGFLVMDDFKKPAYPFNRSPSQSARNQPLFAESRDFVQPNKEIRIPNELWGHTVSGVADPQRDNVSIWSHELANSLRNGSANRGDAEHHLHNLLDPVEARLRAHPEPMVLEVKHNGQAVKMDMAQLQSATRTPASFAPRPPAAATMTARAQPIAPSRPNVTAAFRAPPPVRVPGH